MGGKKGIKNPRIKVREKIYLGTSSLKQNLLLKILTRIEIVIKTVRVH